MHEEQNLEKDSALRAYDKGENDERFETEAVKSVPDLDCAFIIPPREKFVKRLPVEF